MENLKRQQWIDAGYALFAEEGPSGLKVEVLARRMGRSKSGFYHHFADVEVFRELLLREHVERSRRIADRERACTRLVPELLELLVDVQEDLFFQRQLRIHRANPAYRTCSEQASAATATAMGAVWAAGLGLEERGTLAHMVLELVMDNFYLRITPGTLDYAWMLAYVQEVKAMVARFNAPA